MTDPETEPQDAKPWHHVVEDRNHPFGEIPAWARLCAYCALENTNSACPITVRSKRGPAQMTRLAAGSQLALLAAASYPDEFLIISTSGIYLDPLTITTVSGTDVCKWHLAGVVLPALRYR